MDHCRAVIIILPLPQVLKYPVSFQKSCIDWRKIGVFGSSKSLVKPINTAFLIINFLSVGILDTSKCLPSINPSIFNLFQHFNQEKVNIPGLHISLYSLILNRKLPFRRVQTLVLLYPVTAWSRSLSTDRLYGFMPRTP